MRVTKKVNEMMNRGATAVAMTAAIATIYSGLVTEGQVSQGDILRHQIQTALKLPAANDLTQSPQESLPPLAMRNPSNTYGHH